MSAGKDVSVMCILLYILQTSQIYTCYQSDNDIYVFFFFLKFSLGQ